MGIGHPERSVVRNAVVLKLLGCSSIVCLVFGQHLVVHAM